MQGSANVLRYRVPSPNMAQQATRCGEASGLPTYFRTHPPLVLAILIVW